MTEWVEIYGFGSFFNRTTLTPKGIDILIVHERINLASMSFAIYCKQLLKHLIPVAHLTTLSKSEENHLKFINRSNAKIIGRVTNIKPDMQLAKLAQQFVLSPKKL